jgi:DNA-binding phage protein
MTLDHVNALAHKMRETDLIPSPMDRLRVELVAAMREARDAGATLEQIAQAAGVSRQRVYQLLNR